MNNNNIEYRPKNIKYKDFHKINTICFPDELSPNEEDFEKLISKHFWAVIDKDKLLGFSYLIFKDNLSWISRIALLPDYRNMGIGSQLMNYMINYSKKNSKEKIILFVLQNNASAKHLYEKCGFLTEETTYQFVIPINEILSKYKDTKTNPIIAKAIIAKQIVEIENSELPEFPSEWKNIKENHDPPENFVLIFKNDKGKTVGYCRLNPEFPGCFPFYIENPMENLIESLISLEKYLNHDKKELKLTFPSIEIEKACVKNNFKLNYKLYKMKLLI